MLELGCSVMEEAISNLDERELSALSGLRGNAFGARASRGSAREFGEIKVERRADGSLGPRREYKVKSGGPTRKKLAERQTKCLPSSLRPTPGDDALLIQPHRL